MGDSSQVGGSLDDSSMLAITGKVMVVAIISLFFAAVCIFLIHLYTKWLSLSATRRRRFDFIEPGYRSEETAAAAIRTGLDPSVLKTIPVIRFSPKEFKDELECAVCLSQVCEGEKARLLPKCNHGFHVDCIDMWFQSHSTCPLCRNPVSNSTESRMEAILIRVLPEEESSATNNFPDTPTSTLGPCLQEPISNQLPCSSSSSLAAGSKGLTGSTSSRPEDKLVIDIPREIVAEDEEQKSPMASRMRSLKRLLSMGKRATPSPSSPTI